MTLQPQPWQQTCRESLCQAHAQHHLMREEVLVVKQGVVVGEGEHFVFQHLFVDAKVCTGVKVVILGRHALSAELLAAPCLATGDSLMQSAALAAAIFTCSLSR